MSDVKKPMYIVIVWMCLNKGALGMPSSLHRTGRDIYQLGSMIECTTEGRGYDDYHGYGCHCGSGGEGSPVDAIDTCCEAHDRCYDSWRVETKQAQSDCYFGVEFTTYDYNCADGEITCANPTNSCENSLCMCDKTFSECIRPLPYNMQHSPENMNESVCRMRSLFEKFLEGK